MNLTNYFWYYKSVIPSRICDDIVRKGKQLQEQMAVTGGYGDIDKLNKEEIKDLKRKRNSNIVWMQDRWIYNEIQPYIHQANINAGWNFDWDFSESCQFTKYGLNQYYGWHCDSWDTPYNKPQDLNSHGKIRKLSVTISLSDPSEYEGGNLEFDMRNQKDWENNKEKAIYECHEIRPRGSIIVFPSFVWHRVKPVTKGTRYSLVIWNLGQPWR